MQFVNFLTTAGVLLVNSSNMQSTRHAVLIVYKSYATCFPSGPEARGGDLSYH
jgi:hypothetical protein